MTLDEATHLFTARGFEPEPHEPHFGSRLSEVSYLRRDLTYVCLVGYRGELVEAIHEIYLAPKITKGKCPPKREDAEKKGFLPKSIRLLRTREELDSVLDLTPQGG